MRKFTIGLTISLLSTLHFTAYGDPPPIFVLDQGTSLDVRREFKVFELDWSKVIPLCMEWLTVEKNGKEAKCFFMASTRVRESEFKPTSTIFTDPEFSTFYTRKNFYQDDEGRLQSLQSGSPMHLRIYAKPVSRNRLRAINWAYNLSQTDPHPFSHVGAYYDIEVILRWHAREKGVIGSGNVHRDLERLREKHPTLKVYREYFILK